MNTENKTPVFCTECKHCFESTRAILGYQAKAYRCKAIFSNNINPIEPKIEYYLCQVVNNENDCQLFEPKTNIFVKIYNIMRRR